MLIVFVFVVSLSLISYIPNHFKKFKSYLLLYSIYKLKFNPLKLVSVNQPLWVYKRDRMRNDHSRKQRCAY